MSRESEKRDRARKQARIDNLKWLMADAKGRAFMWDLLDKTYLYAGLMTNNSGQTSYLIGKRDLGLDLMADLKQHCFDQFRLMEDEAIAREKAQALEPAPSDEPYPEDRP